MNLFIDANIFLIFYHFSSDDLEELNKLSVLIKNHEINLYLTEQVVDEVNRNRDTKIADGLKEFRKEKLDKPFPQMTKQYPEFKKMREAMKSFDENRQTLLTKLLDDIEKRNLKADIIISMLFKYAIVLSRTDYIIDSAKQRFMVGNPPGKNNSHGDAINWETLLANLPGEEDLVFITGDSDYFSHVDQESFNPFLLDEWYKHKKSRLQVYKNLSSFFKDKFPKIKLANEYEKQILIERFSSSPNFATTHSLLSQLSTHADFTKEELNNILLACVSNSQIYWISSDYDIQENLKKIVLPHLSQIDSELLASFNEIYNIERTPEAK